MRPIFGGIPGLLLAATLAAPWPGPAGTRCQTYYERTLHRWQTVCASGTRGLSTWNGTLGRWETVITPPVDPRRR